MHVNPRHHSLAFIQTGKNAVHHMMMELFSFDDVGQGYDIALGEEGRVAVTLGRHTSDYLTSFYSWTPSASWSNTAGAARSIDRAPGRPTSARKARACGATIAPGSRRSSARRATLRAAAAEKGYRRPVQVMEGNFELMPGICPGGTA